MSGARVLAVPYLDARRRLDLIVPAGSSVWEIVALVLPGAPVEALEWVRVTIGSDLVPRALWGCVRPKPRTIVLVRMVPGNGGILRSVLSIAVGVAALALGQIWAAPLALAAGFGGSAAATGIAGGLISATTLLAGTFLLNSLIPIRKDQSGQTAATSPTYEITGFRNVPNPDGVVPCVMGKVRFAPPYAALPYTESINGESYIVALFLVGYGYTKIRDIRLGDTPIEKYKQVDVEIREGLPSDVPVTLYPEQVLEERLTIDLQRAYAEIFGAPTRFSGSDAEECSIDITFPSGLFWMHTETEDNKSTTASKEMTVSIRISQRLNGAGAWTTVLDWPITGFSQKAIVFKHRWKFPARGRYEIRVERLTFDFDEINAFQQVDQYVSLSMWTAIRSFRPEYPLNFNKPLALIAVKARGTRQLNGVIDNLNCEASRVCLDWDTATETWIERETQNPASLYRFAVQGPAAAYPRTDAEIDLAQLAEFHEFCAAESLAYNRVQDYEASIFDVMGDICAAGRAAPRDDGEQWGVVIDRKQTVVIAHMTPRNAWDFSGERPYVKFPDAFRVKFNDETNSHKPAERVVPWPGFAGTPAITESLEFPGVTSPDAVWLETRRRQYELIYRRDIWHAMQDFEGAISRRGDLIRLSYDVLDKTQVAARVKAVNGTAVTLDELVTMEAGQSYAIRIRRLAALEAGDDQSVLRTIQTIAGESDTVFLTGAGIAPAAGDLAMFGIAGQESMECIVREVEGAEDFARHFTLIPHAPEMFDLLAAEVPPPWSGRVGEDLGGFAPSLDFSDSRNSQYFVMGWP